ncbi:hypothetical protein M8494_05815 [Serratia ureilytica]
MLSGDSQAANAARRAGHSSSTIDSQSVSRASLTTTARGTCLHGIPCARRPDVKAD